MQKKLNLKYKILEIRDNDGRSLDRYSVVLAKDNLTDKYHPVLCLSENCDSPQEVGCFSEGLPGKHLGKKIGFADLPINIQEYIKERLKDE